MSGHSEYVITPADRTTLLQGPVGAILMLGGDRTRAAPRSRMSRSTTARTRPRRRRTRSPRWRAWPGS